MFLENKELDKSIPVPLYFQLKSLILEEIKSGKYETDSLIPTEMELSERFDISRTTVRQAVTELVQEGWLYRVKSKGTFIAPKKMTQDFLQKLETFADEMERLGIIPTTKVLESGVRKADAQVAASLQIPEGDEVFYLRRLRFGDGEPVAIMETYLPYDRCAFLEKVDLEKNSLYESMKVNPGTRIVCARRLVEAIAAGREDAAFLQVKKGAPLQRTHTVGFNRMKEPLEYSVARYRGDRSSFELYVYAEA